MIMIKCILSSFFRHVQNLKKRTGIKLDLMGTNPYEITHFKSGFLGIEPEFKKKKFTHQDF